MRIEVFGDGVDRTSRPHCSAKVSCRGIVEKDNSILVVHLLKQNLYNLPGGGIEANETLEQCAAREVLEETGYSVSVVEPTVTVVEYYQDSIWETHFFKCRLLDENPRMTSPTQEEKDALMTAEWIERYALLELLDSVVSTHPNASNIHNREMLGLLNSL